MIGVVFAMQDELDAFLALCEDGVTARDRRPLIHRCTLAGQAAALVLSGVGKTNAAHATSCLIAEGVTTLISVGVAGGVETDIGTVVIPSRVFYHDVDATDFGTYRLGQVPGMPAFFECDRSLHARAVEAAEEAGATWTGGSLTTGDAFLKETTRLALFEDTYPDLRAVDMESAAIAHVAHLENLPFLVIRTVSDKVGAPSQTTDYASFMKDAARRSANILAKVMSGR